MLHRCYFGWWKGRRIVSIFGELDLGAIIRLVPCVWGILPFHGTGVLEFVQGLFDVAGHGNVDGTVGVVPSEGEAAVERAGPVEGDGVELALIHI